MGPESREWCFKSPHEPSAIKIHTRLEKFDAELAVYRRLRRRKVTKVLGFNVPVLLRSDRSLQVLELSVVKPPFLLDFAGATLDNPRDFTEEAMSDWWDSVRDNFGDDFSRARDVYWTLIQQFGIYYYDLKPGNLRMR